MQKTINKRPASQDEIRDDRTRIKLLGKAIRNRLITSFFACIILISIHPAHLVSNRIYDLLCSFFVGGPLMAAVWLYQEKKELQKTLKDGPEEDKDTKTDD